MHINIHKYTYFFVHIIYTYECMYVRICVYMPVFSSSVLFLLPIGMHVTMQLTLCIDLKTKAVLYHLFLSVLVTTIKHFHQP
jgi:hypothetical protein